MRPTNLAFAAPAALLLMVAACAQNPPTTAVSQPATTAPQPVRPATVAPMPAVAPAPLAPPANEIIRGTGTFVGRPVAVGGGEGDDSGGITLNFINTDVREVVRTVLGDFLNLNYTIDPSVQGQVTIQTSKPLDQASVLPVLEQSLRVNNLAITRTGNLYRVGPMNDAVRHSAIQSPPRNGSVAGFGTSAVQLRYVGVAEMRRLIEPIFPSGSIVHADPARNLLILSGTEQERGLMMENISMLDVDWLSGMSFAMFSPRNVEISVLTQELEQVVGGKESPLAGLVRFVPIQRLNSVLVISPQPEYLEELRTWVERLDRSGEGADQRMYFYRVQNGRAADIAGVLNKAMGASKQSTRQNASAAGRSAAGLGAPVAPPPAMDGGGDDGISVRGLGELNVTADETNNALLITATPREYRLIESTLRQIDVPPLQVLLEAAVAEVTLTNDLRYGVQYYLRSQQGHHQSFLTTGTTSITPTVPGFGYVLNNRNIRVILDALESITRVNVVSSPQVLVLNNQTASLTVGDEVPVAIQQATSITTPGAPVVNSIQYKNTGIILKATPRVNQGGMVMMDIAQEVSDVANTTSSTLDSPTIRQRKISSSVAVRDGETIALGGLIKDSRTDGGSGIPVLRDIPALGFLFGSTTDNSIRTELLVLITPHVVESMEKARTVTEELRTKLPAAQRLAPKWQPARQ